MPVLLKFDHIHWLKHITPQTKRRKKRKKKISKGKTMKKRECVLFDTLD